MAPIINHIATQKQEHQTIFWKSTLASFFGTGAWIIILLFFMSVLYAIISYRRRVNRAEPGMIPETFPSDYPSAKTSDIQKLVATAADNGENEGSIFTGKALLTSKSEFGNNDQSAESGVFETDTPARSVDYRGVSIGASHTSKHLSLKEAIGSQVIISLVPPFEGSIKGTSLKEQGFLGRGAFGSVCKVFVSGIDGLNEISAAWKTVFNDQQGNLAHNRIRAEAETLLHCGYHPNIVRLIGVCTTSQPGILIEICARGCLEAQLQRIFENGTANFESHLQDILIGICSGMEHLTERSIVHRDLAPRNILLDEFLIPKIADFGLAAFMENGVFTDTEMVGMPVALLALESFEQGIFTEKTDVWAFGLLLYEVLTYGQQAPYPESLTEQPMELYKFLFEGHRPEICRDWGNEARKILNGCLTSDPDSRPSFRILRKILSDVNIF